MSYILLYLQATLGGLNPQLSNIVDLDTTGKPQALVLQKPREKTSIIMLPETLGG
jgi:hypothetical protein